MKSANLSSVKLTAVLVLCIACIGVCAYIAFHDIDNAHDGKYDRCEFPRLSTGAAPQQAQEIDRTYVPFCIATYRRALALPSLTPEQAKKLSKSYSLFYTQLQTLGQQFLSLRKELRLAGHNTSSTSTLQIEKLQNQMVDTRVAAWRSVKGTLTCEQLNQLREMALDADYLGPIIEKRSQHGHAVLAVYKNEVVRVSCVHMPDNSRLLEVMPAKISNKVVPPS